MAKDGPKALGARALSKQRIRDDIISTGLRLFGEHGYNAVSTQQIAERAGVTQRTLFRYFPQKSQIVFDNQYDYLDIFETFLDATMQPGVDPMDAVRSAFHVLAVHFDINRDGIAVILEVINQSNELRAIERTQHDHIDRLVAFALDGAEAYHNRHAPGALPSLPSRILAAVIFATVRPVLTACLMGEITGSLVTYSLAAWTMAKPTLEAADQFSHHVQSAFNTIDVHRRS